MNISKFDQTVLSGDFSLIYFYASWCGPCKAMSPILKKLQGELGKRVNIIYIDIEKSKPVTDRYKIRSTPTLILLNKGKTLWRKTGGIPLHVLKSEILNFL